MAVLDEFRSDIQTVMDDLSGAVGMKMTASLNDANA